MVLESLEKVGREWKKARLELGLTQPELAVKLGYSRAQTISDIERGICYPRMSKLDKLRALLADRRAAAASEQAVEVKGAAQ